VLEYSIRRPQIEDRQRRLDHANVAELLAGAAAMLIERWSDIAYRGPPLPDRRRFQALREVLDDPVPIPGRGAVDFRIARDHGVVIQARGAADRGHVAAVHFCLRSFIVDGVLGGAKPGMSRSQIQEILGPHQDARFAVDVSHALKTRRSVWRSILIDDAPGDGEVDAIDLARGELDRATVDEVLQHAVEVAHGGAEVVGEIVLR
jgi:hypothetical protein